MSRRMVPPLLATALLGPAALAAGAAPVELGTGDRPWVSVDRQGVTHVAWEQDGGLQSTLHYRRRAPGAAAFEADRTFAVAPGQDFSGPMVLQDPAPGTRLVIVAERCCAVPGTWAMASTDNGATWSAPAAVFDGTPSVNATNGRVPLFALTASSLEVVIGNPGFRLAQAPAALAPTLPLAAATPMGGAPYDTQVTLDEAGAPVFAWSAGFSSAFLRRGVAGADVPVIGGGSGVAVHVAGGPRGVGVVTLRRDGAGTRLEFRRLAGGALGAPVVLSDDPADTGPSAPFVATDRAGRFHVVWRRGGADGPLVYRRSEDGATWTGPIRVAAAGGDVHDPVAAGSTTPGEPGWVVWEAGAGSASRILAAPLSGPGAATGGGADGAGGAAADDPRFSVPDRRGIADPRVIRNGPGLLVAPRRVSLRSIRRSKCVRVRVQTRRPATIGVAIFSGRRSRRVFGRATVRFRRPGKRVVCVGVPLRARTFDVRQPFRFALAVRQGVPGTAGRRPAREVASPVFRFLP